MPNYDQATADKFKAGFAQIAPTQASGGFNMQLYGQQDAGNVKSVTKTAQPNFFQALGASAVAGVKAVPGIAEKIAHTVFIDPFQKTAKGITSALTGNQLLDEANRSSTVNNEYAMQLFKSYRAGKINKEKLDSELVDVNAKNKSISNDIDKIRGETDSSSARDFVVNAYASVLTPLTMVGGLSADIGGNLALSSVASAPSAEAIGVSALGKFVPQITNYLNRANETLEAVASKVPSINKALNTTPEANSALKTAFNVLVKNPIQLNLAVRDPISVMYDASRGKYGQAAENAALIGLMPFAGGPLGVAQEFGGKITSAIKLRAFGKLTFIDEVGKLIKDDPIEYLKNLQTSDPNKYKDALQAWKSFEALNVSKFDGDTKAAVENIAEWHAKHSNPLGNYTASELTDYWIDFKQSLDKVHTLAKGGQLEIDGTKITAEDIPRIGLGKFGSEEKYALIKELQKFNSADERTAVVNAMIADGYGWAQSPTMRSFIQNAAGKEDFAKQILRVKTGRAVKIGGAQINYPTGVNPKMVAAAKKFSTVEDFIASRTVTQASTSSPVLEKALSNAKPRYAYGSNQFQLKFPDDVTKALYIVAQNNPSKRDEQYMSFLRSATGKTDSEIRALGQKVKAGIKSIAKSSTDESIAVPSGFSGSSSTVTSLDGDEAALRSAFKLSKAKKAIEPIENEAFPRNYFPIFLSKAAKGYDTEVIDNIDKVTTTTELADVLDRSIAPKGIAGAVGGFFEKLGLSPKDRNAQAYLAVRRNIAHNLLDFNVSIDPIKKGALTDSDYIMQKLGNYADTKKSVFDLRQLRVNEIKEVLGVGTKDAQNIKRSIVNAYTEIPLQVRGIGNKAVDFNMKYNPFATQYSRTQGALRYAYNPFFATQEIIETETLAQALTGGKRLQLPGINTLTNVFRKDREELDSVVQKLESKGIFHAATGRGEFAEEAVTGGISAHLRSAQKISIAGFVDKLAQKHNMTVDQYLDNYAEEAADLSRSLVQYPKKSALNSPLATTLSIVAFPARYNIKVTQLAAKALGQQSPLNQVLILNSLMNFGDWVNSDEGLAWQSKNSEAIGLFKYFTPLNTIGQLSKVLTGNAEAAADYGSLGGLPFGVIGQVLDHQGIIQMNTPYVNQKTGEVLPDYVPKTAHSRVKTALDDLINSVFSYPGRMIGGPSKGSVIDTFTSQVPGVGVQKSDKTQYDQVDRSNELTPQAQHRQAVIRQANGLPPINSSNATAANPFADYAILPPKVIRPLVKRPEKRSVDASLAAKDAQFGTGVKGPKPKKVYAARPIPQ